MMASMVAAGTMPLDLMQPEARISSAISDLNQLKRDNGKVYLSHPGGEAASAAVTR
jgi:hypothetical protein